MLVTPIVLAAFACPPKAPAAADRPVDVDRPAVAERLPRHAVKPKAEPATIATSDFPYPLISVGIATVRSRGAPAAMAEQGVGSANIVFHADGHVTLTSPAYTIRAKQLSFADNRLTLRGDVSIRVQVAGAEPVRIQAERIELNLKASTLHVRGGKM